MLDTDLMNPDTKINGKTELEVDQYFKTDVLQPGKPGYLEPLLFEGSAAGQLDLVFTDFGRGRIIMVKRSSDAGRTWDEPTAIRDSQGNTIVGFHSSWFRMASGTIGMVYSTKYPKIGHPGREGGMLLTFRRSEDDGETWSDPILIDDVHACCTTGHALVLTTGRIVAPAFRWISPIPTNDAEGWMMSSNEPSPSLSYSFSYVSDDEGKTWKHSLSDLYVSIHRAAFDLEEPTAVELDSGRLLMHMRSEVGRIYRSESPDHGISWLRPVALPIAASYTPQILKRIPSSKKILMVWNQISRQEIVMCVHRHRLSCAVSDDQGATWGNFKNLESLDDATVITPPPDQDTFSLQPYESYGYRQPQPGLKRYHRAPGILRICYPSVAFVGDEVAIAYDIGEGTLGDGVHGCRLRVIPTRWFLS